MLEGDPADVIARRAQELGCDAIVMGSRGMGRIANLVIGSVATKVVHLTALPVTLVK
jgi:nucleotide-binding universal stress UspA family protein